MKTNSIRLEAGTTVGELTSSLSSSLMDCKCQLSFLGLEAYGERLLPLRNGHMVPTLFIRSRSGVGPALMVTFYDNAWHAEDSWRECRAASLFGLEN